MGWGEDMMGTLPNCYRCGNQPCTCADGQTIYHGDCLETLKQMEADSVHVVVTSPPYFALRSYLPKDHPDKGKEIGSEQTPEAFIQTMVEVFREVRRVLRPDGVCWINLGDSYATGGGRCKNPGGDARVGEAGYLEFNETPANRLLKDVPAGNLLNIPHRVAEALRQDGWIWRQTIIFGKRSPMPEAVSGWKWMRCRVKVARKTSDFLDEKNINRVAHSGNGILGATKWAPCPGCEKCIPNGGYVLRRGSGRCTTAHEYIFLMAKSSRYFWDSEASKERAVGGTPGNKTHRGAELYASGDRHFRKSAGLCEIGAATERNPRSVWTLSSEPTKVRHFATFPSALVMKCLASAPVRVCPHCGAPWAPVVDSERVATRPALNPKAFDAWKHTEADGNGQRSAASPNLDPERHIALTACSGYRPTCSCPPHDPIGGTVLDPFCGIGTTGQTARHIGMAFIGIDLNRDYLEHAKIRIAEPPRWWLRKQRTTPKTRKPALEQGVLFQ